MIDRPTGTLAERGVVVYLATSVNQQISARAGRHRPLLHDTDPGRGSRS